MSVSTRNKYLLSHCVDKPVRSITGVIGVMTAIEKTLTKEDGLWWFNWLYRQVTIAIQEECTKEAWKSPRWVVLLDVEFGKLYFEAIAAWERDPKTCPYAWRPLFSTRSARYVAPVQYALAGLCAHINRDLPVAAQRAAQKAGVTLRRRSPEEDDYNRINTILYEVELRCLQELTSGWIREVSTRVDPYDRKLAIAIVRWMRDLAWSHAETYAALFQKEQKSAERFIIRLDRITEVLAKGMLLPTTWRKATILPRRRK